jgi:uncharacterized protein (TIGR03435 family)
MPKSTSVRNPILAITISLALTCLPAHAQTSNPTPGPTTTLPKFAVASVRPNALKDGRWRMGFTDDGYSAMGVTLDKLIQEAYGVYDKDRIVGEPAWAKSDVYNLEAKVDDADITALQALDVHQRSQVLQALLADRFQLTAHLDTRDLPIYALVVDKNGPKLTLSIHDSEWANRPKGMGGLIKRSQSGQLTAEWMSMPSLAQYLSFKVDRKVVDKTGLTGHYDLSLDWAPEHPISPIPSASNVPAPPPELAGPSIFTAVREQLGLRLEPQKGPVEILVIDHVNPPSPN